MNRRTVVQHVRAYTLFVFLLLVPGGCAWYGDTFFQPLPEVGKLGVIEPLKPASLGRVSRAPGAGAPVDAIRAPKPTPATAAPEKLDLPLAECRVTALRRNLDIRAALVGPLIAENRISEEKGRFEAAFTMDTAYANTNTPVSTTLEGSRATQVEVNTGVEMPLRTGGVLRFNLADQRSTTNNPFSTLNPAYKTDFSVSFSQPLLRNAGRKTATYGIRLAQFEHQISRAATRLEVIRVLAAVDRVYWRLYAARRVLDVRRQDYRLAQRQLETTRRFVDSGERSQVDVIRAEAALAGRLEGIIVAENALRDREREMKRVLNRADVPLNSRTVLVPQTEPTPVHYDLDTANLIAQAMKNRMELLELELQISKDTDTVGFMKNQLLPLVTLDYTYNVNGLGTARWDAYDLLESRQFKDRYAGIKLLIPLGNQVAKSRLRQAVLTRRQRLETKAGRESLIRQEVLAAADSLEAAWQRILANRQTVLLDARLLEAEQRQYKLGLNTSTDVLDAQAKLADAQSAEVQALTEYQIALVDLAYATGTILGADRVRWEREGSAGE